MGWYSGWYYDSNSDSIVHNSGLLFIGNINSPKQDEPLIGMTNEKTLELIGEKNLKHKNKYRKHYSL